MTTIGVLAMVRAFNTNGRNPVILLAVPLLVLAGCATIRRHEAEDTERLLAAAGFQMRPADTPERLAHLNTMPPYKIVPRTRHGNLVYTFADPENCHCLYVGGSKEYSEYQRLTVQQDIAREYESASMNWGLWGPWWSF